MTRYVVTVTDDGGATTRDLGVVAETWAEAESIALRIEERNFGLSPALVGVREGWIPGAW